MTVLVDAAPPLDLRPRPTVQPPGPDLLPLPNPRGPVSQGVVDLLTGRGADIEPVGASAGTAGDPIHDADVHTALWVLNAAQVVTLDGVDPERAASLRARTLHWYLEQGLLDQLRRRIPVPHVADLVVLVAEATPAAPARLPGRARALAWALGSLEAPLQPLVAGALRAASVEGGMAVPVDVPACALARTNAMWLFARDRRLRGAALGLLCLGPSADVPASAELVRALERCTPWLVPAAAWGIAVDAELGACATRCAAR